MYERIARWRGGQAFCCSPPVRLLAQTPAKRSGTGYPERPGPHHRPVRGRRRDRRRERIVATG